MGTILGIGNPFYDRFAFVDDSFLLEQGLIKGDTALTENRQQIDVVWNSAPKQKNHHHGKLGGSSANVIKVLANLGHPCALCGKIGKDDVGQILLEKLNKIGIRPLLSQGNKGTGLVNCFITPDCQRTMQTYLGSAAEFSGENVDRPIFDNVEHLHLEGYGAYYGNALEKCIALAKERNATISLDLASPNAIQHFKPLLKRCIANADLVFGNTQEMLALCETDTPQAALAQFGVHQTVVATVGEHGCWVKASGEKAAQHFDALKVSNVIDTTGAGDYFDGGFLHGIFMKKDISECVAMGNLTASYVIRELGADLSDAQWKELKGMINMVKTPK